MGLWSSNAHSNLSEHSLGRVNMEFYVIYIIGSDPLYANMLDLLGALKLVTHTLVFHMLTLVC